MRSPPVPCEPPPSPLVDLEEPSPLDPLATGIRVAALCLAIFASCETEAPAPERPNVVLIVIDTLRADHVSALGYELNTTPRLERLAERSAVFEQAVSHSPWTRTSMASLISGLQPSTSVQLCSDSSGANCSVVPRSVTTLAETLAGQGYDCRGVAANVNVEAAFGFGQGFGEYVSLPPDTRSTEAVTDQALEWLGEFDAERPFFLYAHYLDPHSPYEPPPGFRREFRTDAYDVGPHSAQLQSKYDAEIAAVDASLGRLLGELDELGLAGRTALVTVSDHGEEFNDHGGWNHGYTMYDELLRVPLLLTLPGVTDGGLRVGEQVRLIDVMPTVLDYVGVSASAELHGSSLLPSLRTGVWEERSALSEMGNTTVTSLREPPWKLLHDEESGTNRLFDIVADPRERTDLASEHPDVVAAMLESMRELRARARADGEQYPRDDLEDLELTEEQLEMMRALGYIDDDPDG